MRIWLLGNGSARHRAHAVHVERARTAGADPSYGVLIEHDDGLFLFGLASTLTTRTRCCRSSCPSRPRADDAGAARAGRLLDVDVTTLVNSHLHFDHVGGNKHFSGIPNVLHEAELVQARNHEPFEHLRLLGHDVGRRRAVSDGRGRRRATKGLWLFETLATRSATTRCSSAATRGEADAVRL